MRLCTTRSDGYFEQKALSPSGEDIYMYDYMQLSDAVISCPMMRTKLMNMILSSGTPCSISTSTAFMADPPVARYRATKNIHQPKVITHTKVSEHLPNIGSSNSTYLDAISWGNWASPPRLIKHTLLFQSLEIDLRIEKLRKRSFLILSYE